MTNIIELNKFKELILKRTIAKESTESLSLEYLNSINSDIEIFLLELDNSIKTDLFNYIRKNESHLIKLIEDEQELCSLILENLKK